MKMFFNDNYYMNNKRIFDKVFQLNKRLQK